MKIKFFNPKELEKNLRASVHKSGKLGFTMEAAKKLALSVDKSVGIGVSEDESEAGNLYMIVYPEKRDDAFPINMAGGYYSINTKALFDNLKLNYASGWIAYDISEETIENEKIFKFTKRAKPKNDELVKTPPNAENDIKTQA